MSKGGLSFSSLLSPGVLDHGGRFHCAGAIWRLLSGPLSSLSVLGFEATQTRPVFSSLPGSSMTPDTTPRHHFPSTGKARAAAARPRWVERPVGHESARSGEHAT
ncbi:hypothetical protein FALCPG4_003876 [Fusarium falciforme]